VRASPCSTPEDATASSARFSKALFSRSKSAGSFCGGEVLALNFERRSGVPSQQRIQSGSRETAVLFEHHQVLDQFGERDLRFQHVLLRNAPDNILDPCRL
jgi:hypothetical protein